MKEYFWQDKEHIVGELADFKELILMALGHGEQTGEYREPVSYWMDGRGWLYIKWNKLQTDEKPVVRYRLDEDGVLTAEPIKVKLKRGERLRGDEPDSPVVLITGDTHGDFKRIIRFCEIYKTTKEDVMIILGDAAFNYFGDWRDASTKNRMSMLPLTLFCVHGNHEMRPESVEGYETIRWHGGEAYAQKEYPNLIFAKDGEIYDIAGKKTIVIGGAYSVDKWYRLHNGYRWFADEQPSEETKQYVQDQLAKNNWKIDVVLSHTTPYQYRPVDRFLVGLDQSTVDSSTEEWLREIEIQLSYKKWYAGHYHCDRVVDAVQLMFRNVELFCSDRDLGFSME